MSQAKQPTLATQLNKAEAKQTVQIQQASELLSIWGQNPTGMRRALSDPRSMSTTQIALLQRTIGNQSLGRLVVPGQSYQTANPAVRQIARATVQRHPPPPAHRHPHPPPRSLNASVDPNTLSGSELEDEVIRIEDYLLNNPSSSEARTHLEQEQRTLNQALNQRKSLLNDSRQMSSKLASDERKLGFSPDPTFSFSTQFGLGFGAAAAFEIAPNNWAILGNEIKENEWKFYAGAHLGYISGAAQQFWRNVEALGKFLWYISPPVLLYHEVTEASRLIQEEQHRQHRNEQIKLAYKIATEAITALKDPGFWAESGEHLGEAAGFAASAWFNNRFMQMSSFQKGKTIGDILGRIVVEVLLLFIGVEEILIKGALAIARIEKVAVQLERVVARLVKYVPSLEKVLEANKARKLAQQAERAAKATHEEKQLSDLAKRGATKRPLRTEPLPNAASVKPIGNQNKAPPKFEIPVTPKQDITNIPGRVKSRINIARGHTRFTPKRNSGNPYGAGLVDHVIPRHFKGGNKQSQFKITVDRLKQILQDKTVVGSPVDILGSGNELQYSRVVNVQALLKKEEILGITRLKDGAKPTTWLRVITDSAGNLITTYPIPAPK